MIRYADTAFDIGNLDVVEVTNSEFAYNDKAFKVASTTNNDPSWAALPCIPPYLSHVDATTNWFGSTGIPGADIDLMAFGGLAVPGELSSLYGAVSAQYSADAYLGNNTVPWTLYSYMDVTFPVTPIEYAVPPPEEPFPALGENANGGGW